MSSSTKSNDDLSNGSDSDDASSDDASELVVASTVALVAMNHYTNHMNKRKRSPPRRFGYQ